MTRFLLDCFKHFCIITALCVAGAASGLLVWVAATALLRASPLLGLLTLVCVASFAVSVMMCRDADETE